MQPTELLTPTPAGLFCPPGNFYIDPTRPVARALITHGHSDHARPGHEAVLATRETLDIMAIRYGAQFAGAHQSIDLAQSLDIDGVTVTFHPAGHVLGSAQVAVERAGLRAVVSGDYKRAADPTCVPFAPVRCDIFVTEATFGLPVFRHAKAGQEIEKLLASRALFPERAHLVGTYPLGKAQRVMALIRQAGYGQPIYIHGALEKLTNYYAESGVELGEIRKVAAADRSKLGGDIVLCPPEAIKDLWARRFPDPVTSLASGWMRVRARARQRGVELPLVISDHADWDDLCATILETGCSEVWVTHGEEDALVHWARLQGLKAAPLHLVGYGDDEAAEAVETAEPAHD
ncbi:MAG: ligase-associated DNA damage response exonuclease [Methylobacteriaceae bacterium]|nr:ligase-associated DNA damage response exonuclease [Methylobacteriaceae bacterium]